MAATTSLPRQAGALLAPVALLALACGVTVAAQRRRPLAALPTPTPDPVPAVESFEVIAAGRSALLRVQAGNVDGHGEAVLVLDRGESMDLLTALPAPMAGGALGFACERGLLDGVLAHWLQLDGRSIALPQPLQRTL